MDGLAKSCEMSARGARYEILLRTVGEYCLSFRGVVRVNGQLVMGEI